MKISRSDLFDLVWSQPRTQLSKRFGISDVALAKRCAKANIPMPPRGYWAKLESKRPVVRATLPQRLPGAADIVSFERNDWYRARTVSLEELPVAPVFPESIEALVGAAVAQMGRVRFIRDLSEPHSGLTRVLAAEASRREQYEADPRSSYYKPYFDEPHGQRQLRLINSLLQAFNRIGCKGSAYAKDEWIKGVGTTYHLVASVVIGDTHVSFQFEEGAKAGATRAAMKLALETSKSEEGTFEWSDAPKLPLERQLDTVARGMLEFAEQRLRANAQYQYEWALERQADLRRKIREEQEAAERKRLAAIAAEQQRVRDRLHRLAANLRQARDIRDLVLIMEQRMAGECDEAHLSAFGTWREEALTEADRLDPALMPLEAVPANK